ncbi:hypothetical protein LIER_43864 [Lithospermum erythrorhizon]|uniref:Uncharacterized protein n=1 Tax=Lithospermum erythrorhizon TaxID=34254 RepID=A0AAV3R1L2_LITER
MEIINYLVQNTKIDMYAVNLSGLKVVDILAQTRRDSKYIEIYDCLHNHPLQSSNGVPSSEHVSEYDYPSSRYQKLPKSQNKNKASKRMNPMEFHHQNMYQNMIILQVDIRSCPNHKTRIKLQNE